MNHRIKIIGLTGLLIAASFFVVLPSYARNGSDDPINQEPQTSREALENANQLKTQNAQSLEAKKAELDTKRQDIRHDICQKTGMHAKSKYLSVQLRVKQINERINKRVDQAKAFVTEHKLSVDNYDAMLADIATKKATAETAAQSISAPIMQFNCENNNAKAQMAEIKAKTDTFKKAVGAYKSSVKELLQAVKSAAQAQLQSESVSQNSGGNR